MRKSRIARSQPPRSPPKRVGRGSRHSEISLDKRALRVPLSASQLTDLKKLARASGTTMHEQVDRAIDAYLLGVSREEIALLHALVAELEVSTARANKALDEMLREAGKAGKKPSGTRRRGSPTRAAAPMHPPEDGPPTAKHPAAIRKRVPAESMTPGSSRAEPLRRSRQRTPKPRAPAGRRR